ncbi:MAG TPA: phosphorylase [Prolixibacteraceae bacterium]|nr:phosphorylase [Prolixibacteraceae bacterium]
MIKNSELILNRDGTIFHLHLKPEQIADTIILVGDPGRAETISSMFDMVEMTVRNREFLTTTGTYNNQRLTVLSTGIGTDNIDIVINELDALANIDLLTREVKPEKRSLRFVRVGTSGSLQADICVNSWVVSRKSIGFDGMITFYDDRQAVCDMEFEKAFRIFTGWHDDLPTPYVVDASDKLLSLFSEIKFVNGVNISAPGFYGPQGRVLRLPLAVPDLNDKLEDFTYGDLRITNYEMESSAIYGLSRMLGHEALTICLIIANRVTREANENYHSEMKKLIRVVLDKLTA